MIAIPNKTINITSSTITEGDATHIEWIIGIYALNSTVKITMHLNKYIGKIYQSVVANNNNFPLDTNSKWVQIDILEYNEARTYNNGDSVSVLSKHNTYLSMEDNNVSNPLALDSKWQYIGKTNAHSFTDLYFTTVSTVINQDLVLEFTCHKCDYIALFGVFAGAVTIEELNANRTVITTKTAQLIDTRSIVDFASYLQFEGCVEKTSHHQSLMPQETQHIRATLSKKGYKGRNLVELATLMVGRKVRVGCTVWGIKSTRTALTPPKHDKWGNVTLSGTDYVKTYTGSMDFETKKVDSVDAALDRLFNQPAVFLLTDGLHEAFTTFGLMTSSELSLENVNSGSIPLRVKSFKYKKNNKEC